MQDIKNTAGEWLTILLFEKRIGFLPLHTQACHFFLEKGGDRCCEHSLGTSLHQIPLIERKKDLDRHLEKRASA